MSTLLLLGGAMEHCLAIREAHKMGHRVICMDGNPFAPGLMLADRGIVANIYDDADVALKCGIINEKVDGVFTVAADVPVSVARAANLFNCRSIPMDAAQTVSNKYKMKQALQLAGVPIPQYGHDPIEGVQNIVKPVDSRGARGVQFYDSTYGYISQTEEAKSYSRLKEVMFEEYLPGPQLSVEGFMVDGVGYFPAVFDRNYRYLNKYYPHIVEDGGEMPSEYKYPYLREVASVMEKAALSCGIIDGIVKGDLVIHEEQVKVIEIAGRMSGGFFGTVAAQHATGMNFIKMLIHWSLGNPLYPNDLIQSDVNKYKNYSAIRFSFPQFVSYSDYQPKIKAITGMDKVVSDPNCLFAYTWKNVGDTLGKVTFHGERAAVVVAKGDSLIDAARNADYLINTLRYEAA